MRNLLRLLIASLLIGGATTVGAQSNEALPRLEVRFPGPRLIAPPMVLGAQDEVPPATYRTWRRGLRHRPRVSFHAPLINISLRDFQECISIQGVLDALIRF